MQRIAVCDDKKTQRIQTADLPSRCLRFLSVLLGQTEIFQGSGTLLLRVKDAGSFGLHMPERIRYQNDWLEEGDLL